MPQPPLFRYIDKAVIDYKMIENGDRILIGASGGKDSTALIEYFSNRLKRPGSDFEFKAIHVATEITPDLNQDLQNLFASWNVSVETLNVEVLGRLKPGRKMNCYWCSTQRRTELLRYAMANGFNKIALGHHLDDTLETLLMNMLDKGTFSTMAPVMTYNNYPVKVIRPLCYAPENLIIEHGKSAGYICSTCTCNYQDNSRRKQARAKLEFLTDGDSNKKEHLFDSMRNIHPDYLA